MSRTFTLCDLHYAVRLGGLIAALGAFGPGRPGNSFNLPKWRKHAKRPSLLDRLVLLPKENTERAYRNETSASPLLDKNLGGRPHVRSWDFTKICTNSRLGLGPNSIVCSADSGVQSGRPTPDSDAPHLGLGCVVCYAYSTKEQTRDPISTAPRLVLHCDVSCGDSSADSQLHEKISPSP